MGMDDKQESESLVLIW